MINTKRVQDRRKLRYNGIDDLLADIDKIVAADKAGKLRRTGNWTAGQAMGHLASWIGFAWEGYPLKPPPWPIRFLIGLKRKRYVQEAMDAGVHIPGVANGTAATDAISTEVGAQRLRQALMRLKAREAPKFHSPAFGEMEYDDRVGLNLRHAELHLSFLHL